MAERIVMEYKRPYKSKARQRPDFNQKADKLANYILETYGEELGVSTLEELVVYMKANHRGYILPPILSPVLPPEMAEKLKREGIK